MILQEFYLKRWGTYLSARRCFKNCSCFGSIPAPSALSRSPWSSLAATLLFGKGPFSSSSRAASARCRASELLLQRGDLGAVLLLHLGHHRIARLHRTGNSEGALALHFGKARRFCKPPHLCCCTCHLRCQLPCLVFLRALLRFRLHLSICLGICLCVDLHQALRVGLRVRNRFGIRFHLLIVIKLVVKEFGGGRKRKRSRRSRRSLAMNAWRLLD